MKPQDRKGSKKPQKKDYERNEKGETRIQFTKQLNPKNRDVEQPPSKENPGGPIPLASWPREKD